VYLPARESGKHVMSHAVMSQFGKFRIKCAYQKLTKQKFRLQLFPRYSFVNFGLKCGYMAIAKNDRVKLELKGLISTYLSQEIFFKLCNAVKRVSRR
jgi:hypothetical protein